MYSPFYDAFPRVNHETFTSIVVCLMNVHFKGKAMLSGSFALNLYVSNWLKREYNYEYYAPNDVDIFFYDRHVVSDSLSALNFPIGDTDRLPNQILLTPETGLDLDGHAVLFQQQCFEYGYGSGIDEYSSLKCPNAIVGSAKYTLFIIAATKFGFERKRFPWIFNLVKVESLVVNPSKHFWGQYLDDCFDVSVCRISVSIKDGKYVFELCDYVRDDIHNHKFTFQVIQGKCAKQSIDRIEKYCKSYGLTLKALRFHESCTESDKLAYYSSFSNIYK